MRITDSRDVTPAVVTDILTACGVLRTGTVTAVTLDMESSQKGFVSNVATFQLSYSSGVEEAVPQRLFLKVTKPDLHPEYRQAGQHEVSFYTTLSPAAHDLPVARCYYAEWDAATSHAALLLADLSQSHFQPPLPLPPAPHQCQRIVESLARIHARWWNHPQLGQTIGASLTPAEADASRERLEASVPHFMDYLGDAFLPAQRTAYERILASSFLQRRAQRLLTQQTVTLIHGDAHTNNLMLPYDQAHGQAILIDWHRWSIDVPLYDLAFSIALHWSAERRAVLEQSLIRHYYEQLIALGVRGYTWDECWNDYRETVIVMTLIPIGQFRRKMPTGVIWYGMEQSVAAFNDLACEELL
jgi:aminoglycoside phosphotransferase (APT) family kinase protein